MTLSQSYVVRCPTVQLTDSTLNKVKGSDGISEILRAELALVSTHETGSAVTKEHQKASACRIGFVLG